MSATLTHQKDAPTRKDKFQAGDFAEPTLSIVQEYRQDSKRFASLQAKAALAGHTLITCGTGYILSKWGHVRHCSDLDSAEAAMRQMGVKL